MKKFLSIFTISMGFIIGLVACSPQKDTNIRVGVMPSENILPIVYADQNGIFEKYGLDVEVDIFKSAVDRDAAFQSGNLDGIASDMLSMVFLNDAAFDVKITAEDITNFKIISVSEENKTPKTIGVSKSTVIEYIAEKYIAETPGDFELVYVPAVPVRLELLNKKELDMAVLPDPLASVPTNQSVLDTSNAMQLYPGVHAFSSQACENKNLKAYYNAYNEAVDIINESDLNEFKTILTDSIGFSPEMFDDYSLPNYNHAIPSKENDFNDVMSWMLEKGYSETEYQLSDLADFSFIQ